MSSRHGNLTMGNSYSSTKPALPTLNISKAKHHNQDTPDDLFVGTGHPQRNVVPLSARLPGAARKLPLTAQQQQQPLVSPQVQTGGTGGSMDHPTGHRTIANNIVAKPQVPALNMGRHDSGSSFTGALGGSCDQSLSARPPHGHSGPGSLQQQQQQQQQHRTAQTSRPAYAPASQQYAGAPADAVRTAPSAVETGPITPAQALKRYGEYLTDFEQSEVLQYQQIWFLGKADVQKIHGNPHLQKTNYGYDDERGDYTVVVSDHIAYRYEVQGVLGKGSFGQVLKVLDYKTGTYKALKIIRNKKRFHHQAQVELKVLQHLRHHDPEAAHNVIHIQEHFMFRSHLCITFELLSINLYEFIKQTNFQGLSLPLIKRFAQQMLVSLKFLRRHSLIHCDLKPENILLVQPQRSAIKVIDFGSSCFVDERMYTYVQSRFYRSPEVVLGLPYGCEIDMWSFGCILAELYMGYPLFPGEDEAEQLLCIMEIMGAPPRHLVDAATRRKVFFDASGQPNVLPNSRGKMRHPGTKTLWGVLRCKEPAFVDLLERCLRWDPADRLTPEQAMAHPWVLEAAAAQQQGSGTHRAPATSRMRGDQVAGTPAGLLQPSSMLAAAQAALAAATAFGNTFTASPASSAPAAGGKAAAGSLSGIGSVPAAGGGPSGTPGTLCSGEAGSGSSSSQEGPGPAPAAAAAGTTWPAQLEGLQAQGSSSSVGGMPGAHSLQQHRSSGGNDTSQSGIDSTPRGLHVAASGANVSAAAPSVLSGGRLGAAAAGTPPLPPATAAAAGGAPAGAGAAGPPSATGTPRAMDTDTPGGLSAVPGGIRAALLASSAAAAQQQQQQQQQGTPLSSHQRRSSGGLDVLTTGGMRGQADQAALVAAHTMVKMQASAAAAAAVVAAGGGTPGSQGAAPLTKKQQAQQQQQQVHVVDAATWAEQQALVAELQRAHDNGTSSNAGNGGLVQHQQQIAVFLQQQQQQQQQKQDMSVVGQGIAAAQRGSQLEQLGGAQFMGDRLLPRLHH